jgi:hypothetical protein
VVELGEVDPDDPPRPLATLRDVPGRLEEELGCEPEQAVRPMPTARTEARTPAEDHLARHGRAELTAA